MAMLHSHMLGVVLGLFPLLVQAQNSTSTTTFTTSVPVSTISTSRSGTNVITVPTSTIFTATTVVSQVITSVSPTAANSPLNQTLLATVIGPAFGVLGALLIITGLPSVFWGHRNRWSTYFVCGFYTLALVCAALIIRFGVLEAVNPPSETLRGLFVLSCVVAGVIGGGIAIFFWQQTRYFIGSWGGFTIGLFIQALHDGGLIAPLGWRWALYMGAAVVGFVLCTLPSIHYHVLLAATACFGATAFILGVDCFTTAGLKEFYVYNLGFASLFPQYADTTFNVTQTMQIELGMIGAVAIMGMAVQARILVVLQARLREITAEQEKKNAEIEAKAAERFANVGGEIEDWEREHGRLLGTMDHSRKLQDLEASPTLGPESERPSSQLSFMGTRKQGQSNGTLAPTHRAPHEEKNDTPLLSFDFGKSIEESIPTEFVAKDVSTSTRSTSARSMPVNTLAKDEDLQKKVELLSEIQNIRNSIAILKQETAAASTSALVASSSTSRSAAVSLDSRYKLDTGIKNSFLAPDPSHYHTRARSLDISTVLSPRTAASGPSSGALGFSASNPAVNHPSSIERPRSTPLGIAEKDWEDYINNRKLFQPPNGITDPIPTTPIRPQPRPHEVAVSPAVKEAMEARRLRESAFVQGGPGAMLEFEKERVGGSYLPAGANRASDEDIPLAAVSRHKKSVSSGSGMGNFGLGSRTTKPTPVILPPQPKNPQPQPQPPVRTFEELTERHKEKIRALQEPVTRGVEQEAELAAVKQRWERSKAVEREVMARRDAEKRATSREREGRASNGGGYSRRHSRSLSGEILLAAGAGGAEPREVKMSSQMKVQEWQRYQGAVHSELPPPQRPVVNHKQTRSRGSGTGMPVPFPSGLVGRTTAGWTPPAQPRRSGGKDPVM